MARATDEPIDELEAVIFLDVDGVLHALKPNGVCRDADPDELIARFDAELYLADDAVHPRPAPQLFPTSCMKTSAFGRLPPVPVARLREECSSGSRRLGRRSLPGHGSETSPPTRVRPRRRNPGLHNARLIRRC